MPTYDEIKSEMMSIAEVLEQYPEPLQSKVFDILVKQYIGDVKYESSPSDDVVKDINNVNESVKNDSKKTPAKHKSSSKESYQMLKDLDFHGTEDNPSLREFCEKKNPGPNIEFNVVSVYYLNRIMGISPVTLDHVYTCYKEVGRKVPLNLKQSIADTAGARYGYLDNRGNDITVPVRGENLVEHELPKDKDVK